MFSATEAARFLDEAHRARARYQNLPEAIAPRNFDEAYAAQEALCAMWLPMLVSRPRLFPARSMALSPSNPRWWIGFWRRVLLCIISRIGQRAP